MDADPCKKPVRVVIADDHHLVRQGLRALLEKQSDIVVVEEAADGREALESVQRLQPDILILDINMPALNGIDVARKLRDLKSPTQIVVLSMYSDESLVKKAFASGVTGYVLKKSIAPELLLAIAAAMQQKSYLTRELDNIAFIKTEFPIFYDERDPFERLTPREREVCQLIAEGRTSARIAEQLRISPKTVEKHRAHVMLKLGIRDVAGLVREAIRRRVVIVDSYDPE